MTHRLLHHLRGNAVGYLALFVALGGSSYAAVQLAPGSVKARALAPGAVTHAKLARNSVNANDVKNKTLTPSDFKSGTFLKGLKGDAGPQGLGGVPGLKGETGAPGPQGPAGHDGSASISARAGLAGGAVTAPHSAATNIPLSNNTWTQSAGQLELLAGSVTMNVPSSCTGSFGNSIIVSVDGTAETFASAPTVPASGTVTMPLVVGTLSEPNSDTPHTLTAQFASSCTKSGEDYTVTGAKLDVINIG